MLHIILHRNLYFEYIFYEVILLDNFNIDKNTMDKLNSMLNNGNLNDMLSQIPPDTMKNLSNMLNSNTNVHQASNTDNANSNNNSNNANHFHASNNDTQSTNTFDFNNIDMNTLMKMKSIMEKMNSNTNPSTNLLQSLKPYLRDEKKNKIDQYSKILNMTNLMELFNQNNMNHKENSSD